MRNKKKKNTGRTVLIVLLALVLLLAIAVVYGFFAVYDYNKPATKNEAKVVDFVVPKGATTTKIGEMLKEDGLINSELIFKIKSKMKAFDGKYQAGEYELSANMGMEDIMRKLQDAKRETTKITIKEGWTIEQIAAYLEEKNIVTKEDFYSSLENDTFDYWFIPYLKETAASPDGVLSIKANMYEGFLFPETYEIYVGASARNIINKMLGQFAKVFDTDMQAKLLDKGMSLQEIITIASIIEGETVVASERELVSSVIYNRLNGNATGKKLQMDCTILYVIGHKDRVLYSDLETVSPYNTYLNKGLPIGPINSPGLASIKAALNPADTNYLYYVRSTKNDGSHKFTSSYSEHINNSSDYQKTLD